MRSGKKIVLLSMLAMLALLMAGGSGLAADKFPSKEIIIVVPFPAGGPQDFGARVLAEFMNQTKELGSNVLVENRPEAGAVKGVVDVYKAKPDGYLLLSNLMPSFAQKEVVYKAPYKILDLTYLAAFNQSDQFFVVSAKSPYKTFKELVDASKKKPLNCGTSVVGSLSHLTAVVAKQKTGINYEIVPFKGSAPNIVALIGNNVDVINVEDLTMSQHLDQVRPLAISAAKRSPAFPNVPTFKELGFTVPVVSAIQGICGPPNLPADVAKVLTNVLDKAIHNQAFIKKLNDAGAGAMFMNGADFKTAAKSSYALIDEYKDVFPKE